MRIEIKLSLFILLFLSTKRFVLSSDSDENKSLELVNDCVDEITKDDKHRSYEWRNVNDFVISKPACIDKNEQIIVRKCLRGTLVPKKNDVSCVKSEKCVFWKRLNNEPKFFNYTDCCECFNFNDIFVSNPDLCASFNGTRSHLPNECYTAVQGGRVLSLGEYIQRFPESNLTVPHHDIFRLDTRNIEFIPSNETIYVENGKIIQTIEDNRVPYLRMFEIPPLKVSLELKYVHQNHSLLLHCYNCDYIGYYKLNTTLSCSTTDDFGYTKEVSIRLFKKVNRKLSVFNIDIDHDKGEGFRYYQCSGTTIFNMNIVTSNKLLVGWKESSTLSFAFFMNSNEIINNRENFLINFIEVMNVKTARIVRVEPPNKILMHALTLDSVHSIENFTEDISRHYGKQFLGTVNSTDFCYSEPFNSSFWKTVKLGQTSCLYDFKITKKNGVPFTRKCVGDFVYGAMWEPIKQEPISITKVDEKTEKWFGIVNKMNENNVNENVDGLKTDIVNSTWKLEPTGVSAIAEAFKKFNTHKKTINDSNLQSLCMVTSKLMEQSLDCFEKLSSTNQTNDLLYSIEEIFDEAIMKTVPNEKGVAFMVQDKFSVFSIDPTKSNVRGMKFFTKGGNNKLQEGNIYYDYITSNETVESFQANIDIDLDIATYFPDDLLYYTNPNNDPSFRIVFKIYNNDILFQPASITNPNQNVEDKVISISIPGFDSNFQEKYLPILFKVRGNHPGCYYWNYNSWVNAGIESSTNVSSFMFCKVNHLTPFTRITDVTKDVDVNSKTYKALNVITQLGLSLSLLGVIGIFISTYYIPEMRFSKSSKIMIQITIALFLEIILFFVAQSRAVNKREKLCITMGSLLQYVILVKFVWMTIIAVTNWLSWYSPFKYGARRDANENKLEIWMIIVGWIPPIVPVFLSVIFVSKQDLDICFPSGGAKIWGFLVPMYIMFTAIVIFFILLMLEFQKMINTNVPGNNKQDVIQLIIGNIRLLIFCMGIPWVFGSLHLIFSGGQIYGTIFSFLFCIFVPLQGFFMFLFLVVLNPRIQMEVKKKINKKTKKTPRDEETTASTRLTSENSESISLSVNKTRWQNNPLYKGKQQIKDNTTVPL